jgi:alkylhydroperoxidase family enzyme
MPCSSGVAGEAVGETVRGVEFSFLTAFLRMGVRGFVAGEVEAGAGRLIAALALAAQLTVGVPDVVDGVFAPLSAAEATDVFRLDRPGGWLLGLP